MNKQVITFMKETIKKDLARCTDLQQELFKHMYSLHGNLSLSINTIVDSMSEDKLDRAMQQIERTLRENKD